VSDEHSPTLKCVIAWSDRRNLCSLVGDTLRALAGEADVRAVGDDAYLVYTSAAPETIRDRLRPLLTENEGLLVLGFETWSGAGAPVDAEWLLRRGH
jgi:hypothetical protein